jgi:hypothetical protein
LTDIRNGLQSSRAALIVSDQVMLQKPPSFPEFIQELVGKRTAKRIKLNGVDTIQIERPLLGTDNLGGGGGTLPYRDAEAYFNAFPSNGSCEFSRFIQVFAQLLTTVLFLDNRLRLLAPVRPLPRNDPPSSNLHVLAAEDQAQAALRSEAEKVFGTPVWLECGEFWELRVPDLFQPPPHSQPIATEGDGFRSYVGACIPLILARRPICLIDEPEICLHPPQALALGMFIGRHASSPNTTTFVATHSSDVLRGILATSPSVSLLRLVRRGTKFTGTLITADELRELLANPRVRTASVLDGLFSDGVAVVEAEGDALVYESAVRPVDNRRQLDIHFAPVGGTAGIKDVLRFYKRIDVPTAVVADLDVIMQPDRIEPIISQFATPDVGDPLNSSIDDVRQHLRATLPDIGEEAMRARLLDMAATMQPWTARGDTALREQLGRLRDDLYRLRPLKERGVAAYENRPQIHAALQALITSAKSLGLFLVHVGALEGWLPPEAVGVSKKRKREWALAAAECILSNNPAATAVRKFVASVLDYLTEASQKRFPRILEGGAKMHEQR